MVSLSLSYTGRLADNNSLDLYDAVRGISGFQRSLALSTHLALNGEIITQAPSLRGAQLLVTTPEAGSWKINSKVVFSAATLAVVGAALTAPKDTLGGHLVFSIYDYAVNAALGFDVDYDESLRKQYKQHLTAKNITPERLDSLVEKIETSVVDIHRPIVGSETASFATLTGQGERTKPVQIGPLLSSETHAYLLDGKLDDQQTRIIGKVASFNLNTNKGRIFVYDEARPIAFTLPKESQTATNVVAITTSLQQNSKARSGRNGTVLMLGRRSFSANGRLKSVLVEAVSAQP
jgi:hypothetical protein